MKTSAQRQGMTEEKFNAGIEAMKQSLVRSITRSNVTIERTKESIRKIKGVDALRISLERGLN